jgi:hypothetical protein
MGGSVARIRKLEIRNFRSIQALAWTPSAGLNCLIGPGDSGKSTILDAIDLCLGARRSAPFGDTDFYGLNVTVPIEISLTLGELGDSLLNFEIYGDYLRGYNAATGAIEDEPRADIETVLTLRLRVESDLEPNWTLYSERAVQQDLSRSLAWKERTALAPARIGTYAQTNLSWARNSVLNRLTEERANLGAELASAAREARTNFGAQAGPQLAETLRIVTETANGLGVAVGDGAQALLDAHSVSIGDGAIALHSQAGIPLRSLGTGSSRLLIAGLQRAAAQAATIALVDEVEYGLEPHRLIRLLDSLGAKDANLPLQVFLTTHSPVALRELSGNQLFIVRPRADDHTVTCPGTTDDIQGTLRAAPDVFLAKFVLVCEGASEVGFIRGLDQYWYEVHQSRPVPALGGAYLDVGGGTPDRCFMRGTVLLQLGYRVVVVVDADKVPTPAHVLAFEAAGGQFLMWRQGRALEDELFLSLDNDAVDSLLTLAKEIKGEEIIDQHIRSKSNGTLTLDALEIPRLVGDPYTQQMREVLGSASRTKDNGWFKNVSTYQKIARDIVGPRMHLAEAGFRDCADRLWNLTRAA